MSVKILALDDMMSRHACFAVWYGRGNNCQLVQAYTAQEAIQFLESESPFDVVLLDHDLADQHYQALYDDQIDLTTLEATGLDVANHIVRMERRLRPKMVVIHSWNPIGANNMHRVLLDEVDQVHRIRFDPNTPPVIIP